MAAGKILIVEDEKNTIIFTLVYKGEEYRVQTSRNQYHTLMTLISDRLALSGFGLCCGMGSCGTCLVEISEKNSQIKKITLSCTVSINDELANTTMTIASQLF